MRAVIYKGKNDISVEEIDDPKLEEPTDVIVKVSSAAICGSDLHFYDGRAPMTEGKVPGHEIMGVIEEAGNGVQQLKKGDRVVLPFNIACGKCFNCARGFTNACLTLNPEGAGAGYGYAGLGPYNGGQAQYVRVPMADLNALKLPGQPGDENEDNFLMLADIFPTAWHANELAKVTMGSSLVIYGAGPVGLLSIMSAKLRGAAEIYCVDYVDSRLEKARELGAIPINFKEGKPSRQIRKMRQKNDLLAASLRPGEDKLLEGVLCGIDAIGYQALDFDDPSKENPEGLWNDMVDIVLPTGTLGIIGVYMPEDPGASGPHAKGKFELPFGLAWNKGHAIGTGQCPVKQYNYQLRDLIIAGQANPGIIVSNHIPLDEAPQMYKRFDEREEGITKVVINPNS